MIVHIGYPKTATTTIQDGLFRELHNNSLINYINAKMILSNKQIFSLILNKDISSEDIYTSSQKINILSSEFFTISLYYLEKIFKNNTEIIDPFLLPEKLLGFFGNKLDDLEILVTLRNQQALIYSHYVQDYRLFAHDPDNNTIEKHVFFNNNQQLSFKKKIFAILYFADLIKKYIDIIGKDKVHILLFEDLQQNSVFFFQQLSKIIGIDFDKVETLLKETHYNQKIKTDIGYIAKISKPTVSGKLLKKLRSSKLADNIYVKIKNRYSNINLLVRNFERFSHRNTSKLIPKLSKTQQNMIFNEFRENNLKLHKEFGVDYDKLKEYGYI